MATPDDAGVAESQIVILQYRKYSTDKELRSNDVSPQATPATVRLVWSFNADASLETAVSVMASPFNMDVLEPYFAGGGGDSQLRLHEISKSSLTHPPVSAIVAKVYDLEIWESDWIDFHQNHSESYSYTESEDLQYGDLPDYDPEKDEDPPHLLVCCGTDRPRNKKGGVLVKASQSGPGFVTIHDYITTVHPWLMRNRDDILDAMDRAEDLHEPEKMDLVVDAVFPASLRIKEKSEVDNELSFRRQRFASIWKDFGIGAV